MPERLPGPSSSPQKIWPPAVKSGSVACVPSAVVPVYTGPARTPLSPVQRPQHAVPQELFPPSVPPEVAPSPASVASLASAASLEPAALLNPWRRPRRHYCPCRKKRRRPRRLHLL